MERAEIELSRKSQALALASCIRLFWCLCLGGAISTAHAQDITVTTAAEPEAQPFPSGLPRTSFARTFRVDPKSLAQLIPVPGAQLENAQQALRSFLTSRGVELSDAARFFYNDRTGILTAQATLQELDAIEIALAALSLTPPEVRLEMRFAEFSEDALPDEQLKKMLRLPHTVVSVTDTNLTVRPGFLILTEAQTRLVIRALEQREGIDMWSAPTITTLSGRQARLSLEQIPSSTVTDPPFSAPDKPMKSRWSTRPAIDP